MDISGDVSMALVRICDGVDLVAVVLKTWEGESSEVGREGA
jgi:hypothetical protein